MCGMLHFAASKGNVTAQVGGNFLGGNNGTYHQARHATFSLQLAKTLLHIQSDKVPFIDLQLYQYIVVIVFLFVIIEGLLKMYKRRSQADFVALLFQLCLRKISRGTLSTLMKWKYNASNPVFTIITQLSCYLIEILCPDYCLTTISCVSL